MKEIELNRIQIHDLGVKYTALNRKFRYKRQLARPRCHSFVNQQRTRKELVVR